MLSKALRRLSVACAPKSWHSQRLQAAAGRGISARVEGGQYVVVVQANKDSDAPDSSAPLKFPSVWLRDNCRCAECFHQSSQSRRINWERFDTRVKVAEISTDRESNRLHIKWSDQHASSYDLQWLRARDFGAARRQRYSEEFYRPKTQHWSGADFERNAELFDFRDVMRSDQVLQTWLQALAVKGVAIIRNSPVEPSVVRQLAERVGFIRRTTYGEEFVVQAKPGATNYAYLCEPLPLHTDLPYYEYKPGVNILHCLVQSRSRGGSNLLVDGFHIADVLRAQHPQDYRVLTETWVDWNDVGSEDGRSFHNIWRAPVICLDRHGSYARINHSIPQRDSHFGVPLEEVLPWYEAYAKFVRLAGADSHAFKTQPGDVLTFNNLRLLHGRTGYDDTEQNVRHIVGAYLDWDIIYSRLRVLKSAAPDGRC